MTKGQFARIDISLSTADAETLLNRHKGELGRRVFWFLDEVLAGPIEVHLTIKVNEQHSERIWSRE